MVQVLFISDVERKKIKMATFKESFRASQDFNDKTVYYDIQMKCEEKMEEFVFTIINNFAEEHYEMAIDKDEIVAAIQLIRMYKEHGIDIHEQSWRVAKLNSMLKEKYKEGYQDGQKDLRDKMTELLNKENEDE